MPVIIYHNPRCSKSRQTLDLLRSRGLDVEVIEYLKSPPSAGELTDIIALLGLEPRQLMRTQEPAYKENGLDDGALTRQQLIDAMAQNPVLIERPIVVAGKRARIGRPPECVLDIV